MAHIKPICEVLFFCGVLGARDAPWAEVRQALLARWGEAGPESPEVPFDFTRYYEDELGPRPWRRFLAFRPLRHPGLLAEAKLASNDLEAELARRFAGLGARPVNLDPGYLHPAKLVLASAKDFAHRIFLRDGIYAEVTMQFQGNRWQALPWTFPDYFSPAYLDYFNALRREYFALRDGSGPARADD